MKESVFGGFYRAKPVSEMKRSGIERALRSKTAEDGSQTRHACMRAADFGGFYRAKPVSEMKRSGIERALRGRTAEDEKQTRYACMKAVQGGEGNARIFGCSGT